MGEAETSSRVKPVRPVLGSIFCVLAIVGVGNAAACGLSGAEGAQPIAGVAVDPADAMSLEIVPAGETAVPFPATLSGLYAPDRVLYASALEAWAAGQRLTFRTTGGGTDRYGRLPGLLVDGSGETAQAALVAEGVAFVRPAEAGDCAAAWLALEAEARERRKGLWQKAANTPLSATDTDALAAAEGRFRLVEGRIVDAALVRGRLYLNFGEDWRTDFTATLPPDAAREEARGPLAPAWLSDPDRMIGVLVRVRGWLDTYNGPEIVLSHSSEVEVLSGRERHDHDDP